MSYESPIRLIEDKVRIEMEDTVVRAVKHYGLTIDKDALIKALNYDREQYVKGFEDGKAFSIETEAIPIEWLKEWAKKEDNFFGGILYASLISTILTDWQLRKEE